MSQPMEVRDLLASPFNIEWRGRNVRLSGVTEGVIGEVETACKLFAISEHRENLSMFFPGDSAESQSEKSASTKALQDDFRAGLYSWGGVELDKWRTKNKFGEKAFVGALANAGGTPLSPDDLACFIVDCREKILAVYGLIEWDNAHPNGPRPDSLLKLVRPILCPKSQTSTES